MPAECSCVPLTDRLWLGSEAKVKNVSLRCEVVVIGLLGRILARLKLFWLMRLNFMSFNIVKEV